MECNILVLIVLLLTYCVCLSFSPSLFHLPSTPQHSSTQFEWTIDEVSSLNPTNVEAHETQFISTIDPEQEAKAQEAITNYFKDKLSVPSPIDCPLRNQKIILPSAKPARPSRNAFAQTELTLPPILPHELEEALRPFCTFTQDQQQTPTKETIGANSTIDHEARDASLRRKLFDASLNSNESDGRDFQLELDECLSPAPTSPEMIRSGDAISKNRDFQSPNEERRSFNLSLSPVRAESEGRCSSFGSLSPISRAVQSPTAANASKKSSRMCTNNSSIYQSTPGSSPATAFLTCRSTELAVQMSVDMSTQSAVSRINRSSHPIRCLSKSFGSADMSAMLMDDHDDHDNENVAPNSQSDSSLCGSEMIIAGSPTARSSSSSSPDSQHSGTPSRKLRRANRKNLSHSFSSSQFLSDESMAEQDALTNHHSLNLTNHKDCLAELVNPQPTINPPTTIAQPLSQTDSGFNEMEE